MECAGIEDGRHHDTRRVLQTNMAEMRVPPHVADMILNHAIKDAPRSRQREALTPRGETSTPSAAPEGRKPRRTLWPLLPDSAAGDECQPFD